VNRHVKVAIVVAPLLGIGGYIIADYFQSPQEEQQLMQAARQHAAIPMRTRQPCQIDSTGCMVTAERLSVTVSARDGHYWLTSTQAVDGVTITLAQGDKETRGLRMQAVDDRLHWTTRIRELTNLDDEQVVNMRVVVNYDNSFYYAQLPVARASLEKN
jgi:hypothetical protein